MLEQVGGFLNSVKEYQAHYEGFQTMWTSLDPVMAARFCAAYGRGPTKAGELDEPGISVVARQIATLKKLKLDIIEPGFRRWMIQSLREEIGGIDGIASTFARRGGRTSLSDLRAFLC